MLRNLILYISFFCCIAFVNAQNEEGVFAEINTTKGKIIVTLTYDKTPITVANFVSLAEGTNDYVNEKYKGKPFYNGLKFHRVIDNFMIQGGDPLGNGAGDPGYKFKDEITDLKHDSAGILSMANSGPGTNGSQFFITHKDTPWLDGKHTVFGKVTEGLDVVNAIKQNDVIESITIIRKGKEAKKFKAEKVFDYYMKNKDAEKKAELERLARVEAEKKSYFDLQKPKATTLPSGLQYVVLEKGNDVKPAEGDTVKLNFAGYFEDGKLLDTNSIELSKAYGVYDGRREQSGGYAPMPAKVGSKQFIQGFNEALSFLSYGEKVLLFIPSNLAWGEAGAGSKIPPNSNVVFEIEVLNQ